jgi:hypothetical protein
MLLLLVQGCTNSKFVIGPPYNRLDDKMRDEFNKFGAFNKQQIASSEARLGTFHVWHRQSELPHYAELLRAIAGSIGDADRGDDELQRWFDTAELHSRSVRECHPITAVIEKCLVIPLLRGTF